MINKEENVHSSYQPKGKVNVMVHLLLWLCKLLILACNEKAGTERFYAKAVYWNGKRKVAVGLIQRSFF